MRKALFFLSFFFIFFYESVLKNIADFVEFLFIFNLNKVVFAVFFNHLENKNITVRIKNFFLIVINGDKCNISVAVIGFRFVLSA